jgi:hypothetical protein
MNVFIIVCVSIILIILYKKKEYYTNEYKGKIKIDKINTDENIDLTYLPCSLDCCNLTYPGIELNQYVANQYSCSNTDGKSSGCVCITQKQINLIKNS